MGYRRNDISCRASRLIFGTDSPRTKVQYLAEDKEHALLLLCMGAALELKKQTDPDNRGGRDPVRQLDAVLSYFRRIRDLHKEIQGGRTLHPLRSAERERLALQALEEGIEKSEADIREMAAILEAADREWTGGPWAKVEKGWDPLAAAYQEVRDEIYDGDIEAIGRLMVDGRAAIPEFPAA